MEKSSFLDKLKHGKDVQLLGHWKVINEQLLARSNKTKPLLQSIKKLKTEGSLVPDIHNLYWAYIHLSTNRFFILLLLLL